MCTVEACSTCPIIRTEMFSRINNICQNLHVLNPKQKLYWLLNDENEEINFVYVFENNIPWCAPMWHPFLWHYLIFMWKHTYLHFNSTVYLICSRNVIILCPIIRTEMFSRINNICQNLHVLNPEQKLYWLLNDENEEILASICTPRV
jgi:hypothetical protein